MNNFTTHALALARLGVKVFPCVETQKHDTRGKPVTYEDGTPKPDKSPYTDCCPNGFKNATTDEATIQEWGDKHPEALVGYMPCTAGLVACDVDDGGAEAIKDLKDILGDEVFKVKTSRADGFHIFWWMDEMDEYGNRNWETPNGRGEIRCDDGYLIAWDKDLASHIETTRKSGGGNTVSAQQIARIKACKTTAPKPAADVPWGKANIEPSLDDLGWLFTNDDFRAIKVSNEWRMHTMMRQWAQLPQGEGHAAATKFGTIWGNYKWPLEHGIDVIKHRAAFIGSHKADEHIKTFKDQVQFAINNPIAFEEEKAQLAFPKNAEGLRRVLEDMGYEFRFNIRIMTMELRRVGQRPWKELNDRWSAELRGWIAENYVHPDTDAQGRTKPLKWGRQEWFDDLLRLSHNTETDPFMEWLEALPDWDGEKRLDTLFWKMNARCAEEDHKLARLVETAGRYILLGAVQRAYEPGAKHDEMVVLVGPQGCLKSTFIECLLPRNNEHWFSNSIDLSATRKECIEQIGPAVIVECPELAGGNKQDGRKLKSFLSSREDRFRAAYARASEAHKRRFILVGTANDEGSGILPNDPTGLRRFIAIDVEGCLTEATRQNCLAWLDENRLQLWAEAKAAYKAKERPFLNDDMADIRDDNNQQFRTADASVEERVAEVMTGDSGPVLISDVQRRLERQQEYAKTHLSSQRVAAALRANGWERKWKTRDGKNVRVWVRSE